MANLEEILRARKTNTADALRVFDELPPVSIEFMLGRWKGYEIYTGHPMDGLLEPSGWYGKMFVNEEQVHPLLMNGGNKSLWALNPSVVPFNIKVPKSNLLGFLVKLFKPFLKTTKAKARLRLVEHRGKLTATMIYDDLAIYDHFAKIDDDTVLGCMDLKGVEKPYFWVMERDDKTPYRLKFNH